jgi:site-specific recombinase XerD
MRYPADPPTMEELVAVMRHAADDRHGWRVRAMIVVLWRAGLRIQEAPRSPSTTSTHGAALC